MTKVATVVRHNGPLAEAYQQVSEMAVRAGRCSLSDTGQWTNQNVMFTKSLLDMFPLAKTILKGALARDECRGAHFKPEFAMPGVEGTDPAERRREAEAWCDRFEANTRRWLKSTIAVLSPDGEPQLTYEDVNTSLIPPRPRLYGLVGAEVIEEVWNQRQRNRAAAGNSPGGNNASGKVPRATAPPRKGPAIPPARGPRVPAARPVRSANVFRFKAKRLHDESFKRRSCQRRRGFRRHATLLRRACLAARRTGAAKLLATAPRPARTRHERHQRVAADRRQGSHVRWRSRWLRWRTNRTAWRKFAVPARC